jgi:hypothetical protein
MKRSPGSSQRLDLFIKVLRVLCPNLTDASWKRGLGHKAYRVDQERVMDLIVVRHRSNSLDRVLSHDLMTRECWQPLLSLAVRSLLLIVISWHILSFQ